MGPAAHLQLCCTLFGTNCGLWDRRHCTLPLGPTAKLVKISGAGNLDLAFTWVLILNETHQPTLITATVRRWVGLLHCCYAGGGNERGKWCARPCLYPAPPTAVPPPATRQPRHICRELQELQTD